jgi:hypothetical protein
LGALDRVALHDLEFAIVELIGFVENVRGCLDLADVVHQRRETELAQQRAVDSKAACLPHREDGYVHHVGERVIVVVLQRCQAQERGAVLCDGLCQRIDNPAAGA